MKNTKVLIHLITIVTFGAISATTFLKAENEVVEQDDEIVYQTNFEGMTISKTSTADINTGFIWANDWEHARTVSRNGSNMLEVHLFDSNDYSILGGFGIGSASNLARCKDGEAYTCSCYIEITGMDYLFVEFVGNKWGSVIIYPDGTVKDNPGGSNMSNVSYVNNVLTFTFTKTFHERDNVDGYIKLTGYNCHDAYAYLDNVVIKKSKYMMDEKFDYMPLGTISDANQTHDNINIASVNATGAYVKENNNTIAKITYNPTTQNKTELFYINRLGFINANREYDISFDLAATNLDSITITYGGTYVSEINSFDINFTNNTITNIVGNKISNVKYENGKVSFKLDSNVNFNQINQFEFEAVPTSLNEATVTLDNIKIFQYATIEEIVLNTSLVKTSYFIGDELDTTNLIVIANYTDNSKKELEATDYEVTGFDSSSAGKKKVIVSYNGKQATYLVTIDRKLQSLTVDSSNVKKEFEYGEAFSFEGIKVLATFETLGEVELEHNAFLGGYSISNGGFDPRRPGTYTVTVTYLDKTYTYDVVVKERQTVTFDVSYESEKED